MGFTVMAVTFTFIHILIVIFWIGGLAVPYRKFPRLVTFHRVFSIVIVMTQIFFSMRCPLTLLEWYLRKAADPSYKIPLGEPFTVRLIRNVTGLTVPGVAIMIALIIGTAICAISLISIVAFKHDVFSPEESEENKEADIQ